MQKLTLAILLFIFVATSQAADIYTSIKSSLYESISERINVQLIDANIPHNYLLIQIINDGQSADSLIRFKQDLMVDGYQVNYANSDVGYTYIIKEPRDSIERTLQTFISSLEGQEIYGLELVILGSINQQRLLGSLNRLVKSSEIKFIEPEYESKDGFGYDISLKPLDVAEQPTLEQDWKLALATGLLNCNYLRDGYVSFSYYQQNLACADFFRKPTLTDKEVANLKDRLYADIQLSIQTPAGFLRYINSFRTERRLELSQNFFAQIPNLSIDSILNYHYKRILNIDSNSIDSSSTSAVDIPSYRLPENYKIKSQFNYNSSSIVNFEIVINSINACVQLNCQSLANLPYITYTSISNTHIFSIRYPVTNETSTIDLLNKVLFIPLSTASNIVQEDLWVSLSGGYLLEAYDESFRLLSNLNLVNPLLIKGSQVDFSRERVSFYRKQNGQSTIQLNIGAIPGGELWEESELLYFVLLNEILKAEPQSVVNKANTLIHLTIPESVYLELNGSTIEIKYRSNDKFKVQNFISSFAQTLAVLKFELSRDQFVRHKKGLIVNLSLQEAGKSSINQLSQMFDLDTPDILLMKRLDTLSYEQFKSFLEDSLAYTRIHISTNHELDEQYQQDIIQLLSRPN